MTKSAGSGSRRVNGEFEMEEIRFKEIINAKQMKNSFRRNERKRERERRVERYARSWLIYASGLKFQRPGKPGVLEILIELNLQGRRLLCNEPVRRINAYLAFFGLQPIPLLPSALPLIPRRCHASSSADPLFLIPSVSSSGIRGT